MQPCSHSYLAYFQFKQFCTFEIFGTNYFWWQFPFWNGKATQLMRLTHDTYFSQTRHWNNRSYLCPTCTKFVFVQARLISNKCSFCISKPIFQLLFMYAYSESFIRYIEIYKKSKAFTTIHFHHKSSIIYHKKETKKSM